LVEGCVGWDEGGWTKIAVVVGNSARKKRGDNGGNGQNGNVNQDGYRQMLLKARMGNGMGGLAIWIKYKGESC
jgi:hypothetical protein